MKNKKLIIAVATIAVLGLVATVIPTSIAISKVSGQGTQRTLSSDITPTKPGRGETVSFFPESLSKFWQMEDLVNTYAEKALEIGELTPYSDELYSWTTHMTQSDSDIAYRRRMFEKYDAFRPTNNVLAWDSKVEAKSYKVIISQDKSFETIEREYSVLGSENSVIFENPYTNTDYYWQVIATKNDDSLVFSDIFNFSVASLPRTVLIQGVSNTRDLGGNVGLNGNRMQEGLIYRGMGLEAITTKGENEFKNELGIKTEIDLRNVGEGTENFLNLSNYYHYPSPLDYYSNSGNVWGIEWLGDGTLVPNFGNAVKVLADKNNYPVYFHCSVGRDRTGWMGLCLNLLCGVSEEVALKEFCLSLFSTSGAHTKANVDFYQRVLRICKYINDNFEGENLSEKMEDYLVRMAGVSHQDCANVRGILLGDIDTGFVPGTVNPDPYTDLAKVTFRRYGESPIIQMVPLGSLLEEPNISGHGAWYHGDVLWDFDHDTVEGDMYLDYISKDKCKVVVHYTGINIPDDSFDVAYNTSFDFSIFDREEYTYKVYDDAYNRIESLIVEDDVLINVVYSPINGYIPKGNSRIIVMAGQSNAAGVGHYLYLENSLDEAKIAEINNGYDNVLMTGYSHGDHIDEFRKVYADRHSMSADSPGTFGFEVGLADRLSKMYPDETTYIVKYAYGGASLNYDFVSPSCMDIEIVPELANGNERGWLYTGLEQSLTKTIDKLTETTNTIPLVEAFMWMQGESDATLESALNLYQVTFETMMDDFTTTFADNLSYKFALYDAAICETSLWALSKPMNGIKKSRADDRNIYIETNERLTTSFEPIGTVTDSAHYDAACYIDLGHMFADAYLEHTVRGYTHNAIEIEAPESITLKLGEDYVLDTPVTLFNGEPANAKLSYFSQQHLGFNNIVYVHFKVNDDGSFTPTRVGESQLRITAYYQDEVRTVLIPVEVIEQILLSSPHKPSPQCVSEVAFLWI